MSKDTKKIEIFIMGKQYLVPGELTILEAMEYAGYQLKRGCGCRAGFCGACATVYRIAGSYQLQVGLACQTKVEPGMYLAQIPFFPGRKAVFDLEKIKPTLAEFAVSGDLPLPGVRLLHQGLPQDLDVMQYIAHLQQGEWKEAADLSFDCVMCGLCASRCQSISCNIMQGWRRGGLAPHSRSLLAERVRKRSRRAIMAGTWKS